jgi:hypothetical protein
MTEEAGQHTNGAAEEPVAPAITAPIPPLTDGVIVLREWVLSDLEAVHASVQDAEIPRFTGTPENHTPEGVERWLVTRARETRA